MRPEEQRSHLEAILRNQARFSDERMRAIVKSSHGQLEAARQRAEEQQSELRNALEASRAKGTELEQFIGRAKAENDQLKAECTQYAQHARLVSAASGTARVMNSELHSMAKQVEDASLMLQASNEQHLLLTRQDSQLRASLQDRQLKWLS